MTWFDLWLKKMRTTVLQNGLKMEEPRSTASVHTPAHLIFWNDRVSQLCEWVWEDLGQGEPGGFGGFVGCSGHLCCITPCQAEWHKTTLGYGLYGSGIWTRHWSHGLSLSHKPQLERFWSNVGWVSHLRAGIIWRLLHSSATRDGDTGKLASAAAGHWSTHVKVRLLGFESAQASAERSFSRTSWKLCGLF